MNVPLITPEELKAELDAGRDLMLLDVREDDELEVSRLDGIVHIPMNEIPDRIGEIDASRDIVVICRSGQRSGKVTSYLLGQGYSRVRNLSDGMNGYATRVDGTLTVY